MSGICVKSVRCPVIIATFVRSQSNLLRFAVFSQRFSRGKRFLSNSLYRGSCKILSYSNQNESYINIVLSFTKSQCLGFSTAS